MEQDRQRRGKSMAAQSSEELKTMHREIERRRRQEMGSLYSSLRSLLPLEYVKGKRSVSDQMNEAVNYINHLQNKIKQMELKRDQLKKNTCSGHDLGGSRSSDSVKVSPCRGGVEVSIISDARHEGFRLSRVLELLANQHGLDVVSCCSTEVNQRVFHTISLQVCGAIYIDRVVLQQLVSRVIDNDGRS